jgi:hypothetical protein
MQTREREPDGEEPETLRAGQVGGTSDAAVRARTLDLRAVQRLQSGAGNAAVSRLVGSHPAASDRADPRTAGGADPGRVNPDKREAGAGSQPTGPAPPAVPSVAHAAQPPAMPTARMSTGAAAAATVESGARLSALRRPTPPVSGRGLPSGHPLKALRAAHRESATAGPGVKPVEANPSGAVHDAAPAEMTIPSASFVDTDVDKMLPPVSAGLRPKRRERMATAARQELAGDRLTAQATVDAFVAARQAKAAELRELKPEITALLSQAGTSAVARIDGAATAAANAVGAAVASARTHVRAQAERMRAQVEADYAATVTGIRAATESTRTTMRGASTIAAGQAGVMESAQLIRLGGLYTRAEGQFRTAAQAAGQLAVDDAAARAREYRSHKINEEDGILDGYLTDNRCEARAEAAEKVGSAYRDELVQEGEKQVTALHGRQPTDEASVRQLTGDARGSLRNVLQQAIDGVAATEAQSLANARSARSTVLDTITQTLRTAESGLSRHAASQMAGIRAQAAQRRAAAQQSTTAAIATLNQAADRAIVDVDASLLALVGQLSAAAAPDPTVLDQTLLDSGAQLDVRLAQLGAGLRAQAAEAGQAVSTSGATAATALNEMAAAGVAAAQETGQGASGALTSAGTHAAKGLRDLLHGHQEAVQSAGTGHDAAVKSVMEGLTTGFDRLNTNITAGATKQVEAVTEGLTNAVRQDMPGAITTEAQKAYDQVQPRWKSVLKWIIIIAIILVVALVLGPMVIGAVTGAAAALGASAGAAGLIGMVVGGALVGAATSAATTVVDNAFAGRALTTGLGTAIAVGALGGALGGAASGLLAGPMQGMTQLARYGVQVGVDMVIDTGINAATGNLTWDNFATGLVMSAFLNGVTMHPRVQAFQHGMSSLGYGGGFDAAAGVRSRVTGAGGPGSAGVVSIDAGHVNVGDTAKPTSPYRGTWDMAGGGHNPNEIRPRAAAEGIGHSTLASDPVTGVAIDKFNRPALDGAGNTIPDAAAPGGIKVKSTNKSLFPESMGRPEIEAAGQTALERAIAGTPETTHTPPGTNPNGTVKNGKFSAIVTTPDGHPIRVEGYYASAPGGGLEIKTVYPASDVGAGRITPVPGSQVSVPGGVFTPPDYDSGD